VTGCRAECDRVVGHPGFCMVRCAKTPDCTEPSGHRKHCTTGTFNEEDWEPDYPLVGMLTRENDAIVRESFDND